MKLNTRIKSIRSVDAEKFRVTLEYADGFEGTADLSATFGKPEGKPLVVEILQERLFGQCFVDAGALAWPNGYELCPDALRAAIEAHSGEAA